MKKRVSMALILCIMVNVSSAAIIVDTGTPTSTGGAILNWYQWFAGEFTLNEATILDDIFGYFKNHPSNQGYGDLTIAVYADGGDIPDVGNELYSSSLYVLESLDWVDNKVWHGITGLNLELSEGDYWVAFEVRAGQTYSASDFPHNAPNPLDNRAVKNENFTGVFEWNNLNIDATNFGLKINGTPVPEPATLLLLGLGAVMLRRKRHIND